MWTQLLAKLVQRALDADLESPTKRSTWRTLIVFNWVGTPLKLSLLMESAGQNLERLSMCIYICIHIMLHRKGKFSQTVMQGQQKHLFSPHSYHVWSSRLANRYHWDFKMFLPFMHFWIRLKILEPSEYNKISCVSSRLKFKTHQPMEIIKSSMGFLVRQFGA